MKEKNPIAEIADAYEVADGIYVLGGLSSGLTVYKQQIRAHNLAFALSCIQPPPSESFDSGQGSGQAKEIAVIGGGIAGLTFASALLSLDKNAKVTIFEKRWDLCPLQQGSDTRWLHPRIYDWPELGSRAPSAGLPVLNWSEGRASDVATQVLDRFSDYCEYNPGSSDSPLEARLTMYLGLSHLRISSFRREIEWMGRQGQRSGSHFSAGAPTGDTRRFFQIVLAAGFGLELDRGPFRSSVNSYWRNDTIGQPALTGERRAVIVSGYGDGGIVDLCRLTIERFRQDKILDELFGSELETVEDLLRNELPGKTGGRVAANVKILLDAAEGPLRALLDHAITRLRNRLRKDISAVLHIGDPQTGSLDKIFGPSSSFLNRVILYLLYKAAAFTISFEPLDSILIDYGVTDKNVILRHGTNALNNIAGLFSDSDDIKPKLANMKVLDIQSPRRLWPLGLFPYVPQRRV